jgi:biopolymer transport protein ExbB
MRKNFLLKMGCLIIVLAAVLAVMVAMMRNNFGVGAVRTGRTQTFFEQFVLAGGPIVWFVLLPMSLIAVYLAAEHSLTIRRKKLLPCGIGGTIVRIIQQFGVEHLETRIAEQGDFVSTAVARAVTQGKGDWFRMRNALAESLQDQASQLLRKIEWINLIGNVSPMVGLFGTVFGMIKLFNTIVVAGGQPQPAQLAEGISVALVTTFWGLFIAIPALAVYGVFRNRIETLVSDAVVETEDVMPQIRERLMTQKQVEEPKQKHPISELPANKARPFDRSVPLR